MQTPIRHVPGHPRRPRGRWQEIWTGFRVVCTCLVALAILVEPLVATAQPPGKLPRIGVILTSTVPGPSCSFPNFLQALHELGYVEGQTISVVWRCAGGSDDQARALAVEVVQLGVDIIVTTSHAPTVAAKTATSSIPIVFAGGGDPLVPPALVASLAHPGGNVTGVTNHASRAFFAQYFDLLLQATPGVTQVALLLNRRSAYKANVSQPVEAAAQAVGVTLHRVEVESPDDFEAAFAAMTRQGIGALIVSSAPFFNRYTAQLAALAATHRLPAIAAPPSFAAQGGLMAYQSSPTERWRRVASFVDRILKGAKPAELPVEIPMKYDLIINLKAAQALGLTLPPGLLLLADEVIK